jgi:tetratricopeptide (TPR) repeat protein/tRNA A-37 threonylcarbamoyl transferase component Bud32
MTPELWHRLKPLYGAALELPVEERGCFIDEACADDRELAAELRKLLAANGTSTFVIDPHAIHFRDFDTNEPPLAEGTLLIDRFRIVRQLGSGGMGDVYEATDLLLQPGRIALKTIRPALAQNPLILSRFKEEVNLARQLTGTNVCRVYELYVPPAHSGYPCAAFLTMEFLDGVTLSSRIEQTGALPLEQASEVAFQICSALQTIHDANIVHRDLKPRNIMLVPHDGAERVVLMDFGIARALNAPDEAITGLTVPGAIVGTPDYMAPEQFEGNEVTPATDIYTLGIVLYELFTGQHPFVARTSFAAAVRRGRQPASPSSIRRGIPPVWEEVIAKCLEYEPDRRYRSAKDVLEALHQHSLVIWKFRSGHRLALAARTAALAGFVLLLMIVGLGWILYQDLTRYKPTPEAQFWYDRAAIALREGTYFLASKEFEMALSHDPKFLLAHARLAEAFTELDFVGQAEREMLIATSSDKVNSIPDQDKRYLRAIRNTLVRNYSAAVQDYEAILDKLPGSQKGNGYVDLGRAYEKAGRISETIASYKKAAQLMPDDPAPFVHLGIWESRQRDPDAASAAFAHAEKLYEASGNMEGLAEVAYQRGYASNEAGDSKLAREYLDKSLAISRQIPNVQLEVRSLSQLSSVEYSDAEDPAADDKSIEFANNAIQLARDNDLEYWSTDGFVRLANAYLDKGDLGKAESYSQQALRLAGQNQHPRLEASANFTLASIRDRQGHSKEQKSFAQSALKYYRDFGFMDAAARSSILVVRAEEAEGDYAHASESGNELLQMAKKSGSVLVVENAEDVLGVAASGQEDYPAALVHFQGALDASRELHEDEAYQELDCADTLWHLGQYSEAVGMLATIPAAAKSHSGFARALEANRARMELSREHFHDALTISREARQKFTDISAEDMADFEIAESIAEVHLGSSDDAKKRVEELVASAVRTGRPGLIAQAHLAAAEVYLRSHLPKMAIPMAEAANQYAASKGLRESEWVSLSYLVDAYKQSGDDLASKANAKKAIDILHDLEKSWGSSVFQLYAARPDHKSALAALNVEATKE